MRRRHALSLLAVSLALSLPAWAASTESERFHQWLDAQWELTLQRRPVLATSLGDPRYNDRLVDTTTAAYRAQARREMQEQLKALAGFDKVKLAPKDRVSYSLLKLDLEQRLAGERFPEWMQPISQMGSLPSFLAQMGTGQSIQPFKTTKDYEDWLKRLALAVPVFDGSIANMREGLKAGVVQPRAAMDKVLPQLTALAVTDPEKSLFWGPIKNFPEAVPAADRKRITADMRKLLSTQVLPAYARLLVFVQDEYTPRARASTAWSA